MIGLPRRSDGIGPPAIRRGGHAVAVALLAASVSTLSIGESGPCQDNAPDAPLDRSVDSYGDPLPDGALVRLGTVRFRAGRNVGGGTFLEDGRTILLAEGNHGARFVDVTTGRTTASLPFDEFPVQRLVASTDAARIAFFGADFIKVIGESVDHVAVWDRGQERVLARARWSRKDLGRVAAACFSPDQSVLALGMSRGSVQLIDAETGLNLASRHAFDPDTSAQVIRGVAFSPDGSRLAVAGEQGFWLWDWPAADAPRAIEGVLDPGTSVSFSPDGKLLALLCEPRYAPRMFLRIVDADTRRVLREFPAAERQYSSGPVVFTADGARVAVACYDPRTLEVWDVSTGELQQRFGRSIASAGRIAISRDDRWIVDAGGEGAFRVWDLRTGASPSSEFVGHEASPFLILFTRDGQSVITAGNDSLAMVWDAATGGLRQKLAHAPGKWVRAIAISPDGERFATSSLDDSIGVWDRRTGQRLLTLYGHGDFGGMRALGFTPDGKRLLSWGDDQFLRVFDLRTGKAIREHALRLNGVAIALDDDGRVRRGPGDPFLHFDGAAFTRDGTRLVLLHGTPRVCDVETGREVQELPWRGSWSGLALSPDDRWLCVVERGRDIVTPLPDGGMLHESSRVQTLSLVELATGDLVRKLELPDGHAGQMTFSADGARIAVVVHDQGSSVHIIDTGTGQRLFEVPLRGSGAQGLAFSPDGGGLAIAHDDTSVIIWDLEQFPVDVD
jgi:WD40 repeat protein